MTKENRRRLGPVGCALIVVLLLIILAMLLGGCHSAAPVLRSTTTFAPDRGFLKHEFDFKGERRKAWVFVPKEYDLRSQWPTIVFLHGLFEAGKDGDEAKCLSSGLGPQIAKAPAEWPFVTIFPQSDGTWRGREREDLVIAALESAQQTWSIDPDRVTLAGFSYGGLGVWEIGAKYPDRFAALVPVSSCRMTEPIEQLVVLPVWAFAFSHDPIVPNRASRDTIENLIAKGGKPKLTVFTGFGHDAWDRAVEDSTIVEWMLAQHRIEPDQPIDVSNTLSLID